MLSYEGSQDLHNWSVVARGILADPLQSVDSAQVDVQRMFLPKLVDGVDETIGDLPLSSG